MAERLAVALDLVLTAFAECQVQSAAIAARALEAHLERHRWAVLQCYPAAPPVEIAPADVAGHIRLVESREPVARMEQLMRQGAVVGEHERAFDVDVEPTHREEAHTRRHEVGHHGTAIGIAAGGQIAARLVEEHVLLALGRGQRAPIDSDLVAIGVGDSPGLAGNVAVDGDAALEDEAISSSS